MVEYSFSQHRSVLTVCNLGYSKKTKSWKKKGVFGVRSMISLSMPQSILGTYSSKWSYYSEDSLLFLHQNILLFWLGWPSQANSSEYNQPKWLVTWTLTFNINHLSTNHNCRRHHFEFFFFFFFKNTSIVQFRHGSQKILSSMWESYMRNFTEYILVNIIILRSKWQVNLAGLNQQDHFGVKIAKMSNWIHLFSRSII